jgi:hypothetical protein
MRKLLFLLLLIPAVLQAQVDTMMIFIDTTESDIVMSYPIMREPIQDTPLVYGYYSPQDTANKNNNVLYWSVNPGQLSLLGIRYEHYFERIGVYGGVSRLKHTGGDNITNIQNRYSLGTAYRLSYIRDQIDSPIATVGLVYHQWLSEDYVEGQVNPNEAFRKFSFELGMGGRIKWFNICGRADFMQMEVMIDLGFNF